MAGKRDSRIGKELSSISHLITIITLTVFSVVLIFLNRLLKWEGWMIPVVLAGMTLCLVIHISGKGTPRMRIYSYSLFLMFEAFYYAVNINTLYDSTALIVIMVFIFAATGERLLVFFGTMCGLGGLITHLLVVSKESGLTMEPSNIIRSCWQFTLILLGALLATRISASWVHTEKQFLEQIRRLEDTNTHANHFLVNVSHEIRTPVNAVMGLAAILEKEEMPQNVQEKIASIQEAGHRVAEQIADIMDFTEIDMKKLTVTRERYMINSLINDLLTQLGFFEDYGLDLVIDLSTDVPLELIGDSTKIKKILWHLITNSFKFTKTGGVYAHIYAKKRDYGINLVLEVSDTGIGMTESELEHISERFYQSDSGLSRTAGGLGLGMPIVNGFARAMNGFLHIESIPGQGTLVRVSIPQEISDPAPCISVAEKEKLCSAGFLSFQTTKDPRVKQYYMEMIDHIVTGLGISFHRVISRDALEKLTAHCSITHLFVGTGEYVENQAYIDSLAQNMNVVLVEDKNFSGNIGAKIALLKKPFSGMQIANYLNHMQYDAVKDEEKRMICPGVRALVVDDDPMNLLVARGIFDSYEMIVSTANSGAEAIECCRTTEYDIIFMDHMMPGMDGVEAMKHIRDDAGKRKRDVTVVALTANASSSAKEMFLSEGFDAFLPKPIELIELERVLKHLLPRSAVQYTEEAKKQQKRKPSVQPETKDPYSELKAFGVDIGAGMQYCQGDEMFYRTILAEYAKNRVQKCSELTAYYDSENWKDYAIRVHSIKSTSKMIGAEALSEQARKLEFAAKETDIAVLRENHAAFLAAYRELLDLVAALLGEADVPEEEEAMEFAPEGAEDNEILEFAPGGGDT